MLHTNYLPLLNMFPSHHWVKEHNSPLTLLQINSEIMAVDRKYSGWVQDLGIRNNHMKTAWKFGKWGFPNAPGAGCLVRYRPYLNLFRGLKGLKLPFCDTSSFSFLFQGGFWCSFSLSWNVMGGKVPYGVVLWCNWAWGRSLTLSAKFVLKDLHVWKSFQQGGLPKEGLQPWSLFWQQTCRNTGLEQRNGGLGWPWWSFREKMGQYVVKWKMSGKELDERDQKKCESRKGRK